LGIGGGGSDGGLLLIFRILLAFGFCLFPVSSSSPQSLPRNFSKAQPTNSSQVRNKQVRQPQTPITDDLTFLHHQHSIQEPTKLSHKHFLPLSPLYPNSTTN
jgi:hypothetical protein